MRNCHHCFQPTCNGPLMIYPPGPSTPSTPVSRHSQPPALLAKATAPVLPIAAQNPARLIEPVFRQSKAVYREDARVQFDLPESSVAIIDVLSGIYKGAQDLDEGLELHGYLHPVDRSTCEPENMGANGKKSVPRCGIHEISIITRDDARRLPTIWSADIASSLTGFLNVRSGYGTKNITIWTTTLGRKLNCADVSYFIAVSTTDYAKGTINVVYFLTVEGVWKVHIKSSPIELTQSLVDAINTIFNGETKTTERTEEEVNQLFKEFGITGAVRFLKYSIPSENKHSKLAPQSESLTLEKFLAMQASQVNGHRYSPQQVYTSDIWNLASSLWSRSDFVKNLRHLADNDLSELVFEDGDVVKLPDPQLFNYCRDFVLGKRDSFVEDDDDFEYKTKLEIWYGIQQNIRLIYPFFPVGKETIPEVALKEAVDAVMQRLPEVDRDDKAWRRVVYGMLNVWVWAVYFGNEKQVNGTHEAGSTLKFDPRVQPQPVEINGDMLKSGDRYTIYVPAMPELGSKQAYVVKQD